MSLFQKKKTFEVMGIVQSIHDYKPMEAQYCFGKKFTKGFASGEAGYFQPVITYTVQDVSYTKPVNALYRGNFYRERLSVNAQVSLLVNEADVNEFKIQF